MSCEEAGEKGLHLSIILQHNAMMPSTYLFAGIRMIFSLISSGDAPREILHRLDHSSWELLNCDGEYLGVLPRFSPAWASGVASGDFNAWQWNSMIYRLCRPMITYSPHA
jgi:hypothetical protein